MTRKVLILTVLTSMFLAISVQHLSAISLEEAMMRLQVEALKAQMDELLGQDNVEKAREILEKMAELDEKICSLSGDRAKAYVSASAQEGPAEKEPEGRKDTQRETERSPAIVTSDDVLGTYEKVIMDTCRRMEFDPAVIWTLLAIESNFSKDPVVVQKRTKCLGPWQHQPEHYIHYRKPDGTPYNPFDINDACEVTVRIMKDNLAVTGSMGKAIRMYCSGSRFLDIPYEQLPKSVRDYLVKFRRIYPGAKGKFAQYGIYSG